MAHDVTTERLLSGLRRLRKSQGASLEERLLQDSALLVDLSNGSLGRAVSVLRHIRRQHAADREGDIPAYFFTLDRRSTTVTLDSRLKAYARRFHVDERTALRRSDRGAVKIAELVRRGMKYDRPWVVVILAQDDVGVRCFFRGSVPTGSTWNTPTIYVNGKRQIDPPVKLTEDTDGERREWFDVTLPRLDLDWSAPVDEAMGTLVVAWKPGLAPMWDLVSYLPDYRIHARLSVDDNMMAEVTVRRWAANPLQ